jgi:hypothetical protein
MVYTYTSAADLFNAAASRIVYHLQAAVKEVAATAAVG